MVKTPGFIEIFSSANRKIVWFYVKNIYNVQYYPDFFRSLEPELNQIIKTRVQQGAIKFNLKLEATYNRPNVHNSSENQAVFIKLLTEEEVYTSRKSRFTIESIDRLLLAVYKYTPMGGSSYIQLPNVDQQCFKWAVIAKHVTGENKFRIGKNYRQHEDKYNFNGLSFPTYLSDITKFEKNN
ncbi:Uncharacterized protein FWK35_00014161 [Aphis craccivora]|uniref:Uncharacterized protein n=1 Tax=Aphis craccivora TaxID=307492 RepID=A0A6G0Y504_APHCR|nr:Uncharacterized protein FWK35_00014161 [Aphis craccivora]